MVKNAFCEMYSFGMDETVGDKAAFKAAARVKMLIWLGKNMEQCIKQMDR